MCRERHILCKRMLRGGVYSENDELMRLAEFIHQLARGKTIGDFPACDVVSFAERRDDERTPR